MNSKNELFEMKKDIDKSLDELKVFKETYYSFEQKYRESYSTIPNDKQIFDRMQEKLVDIDCLIGLLNDN